MEKRTEKPKRTVGVRIDEILRFISNDLWRVSRHEVKGTRNILLNIFRTLILAVRGFISDRLTTRASALTYSSLLAVVPLFAITLGIARGFGFQKVIENQLTRFFPGQTELLNMLFGFVKSFLEVSASGVVLGTGIVFLIASIWTIMQSVEIAVNDIFQIRKTRGLARQATDYLSAMLLIPVLLILSSGISIFMKTAINNSYIMALLSPLMHLLGIVLPYIINCLVFTILYIILPNTKVKFSNALFAGVVAGTGYQAFQYLYIGGQLWVTRYNAIYGSFAAIPLFLLWLQLSWTIVLIGAEIAFAAQNVQNFYFEKETKNVSHRYRYFICILFMNILCKRFTNEEGPMTMRELSSQYQIPARLTTWTLNKLLEMNLISETNSSKHKELIAYQPAVDINKLTVGMLYERMFTHGTEDFAVDVDEVYHSHWKAVTEIEACMRESGDKTLIKDL
jgi:membrane protein